MADPRDCIETGRLLLEALGILQSREIFENFTEDVTRYMYPSAMRSLDEAELFVQKNVAAREQGSDYVFAVTLRESGEFLGIAALHEVKTLKSGSGSKQRRTANTMVWKRLAVSLRSLKVCRSAK